VDAHRLRVQLKELLPAAKVPRAMFRIGRLPLTAAGKPDRGALRAAVLAGDGGLERIS
jgi:acyl-CoA synthetase (AMP-forming)/AMP-acid ligase II